MILLDLWRLYGIIENIIWNLVRLIIVSSHKKMTAITQNTAKAISALFPAVVQNDVISELETKCSNNVPGCDSWTESQLERIWFAVLKLSNGEMNKLESFIKVANTDYRDLLMAAEFGSDLEAHNKWFSQISC